MRYARPYLALALALGAAAAVYSQPGGGFGGQLFVSTPTPLAVLVLNGIDDPVIVADLKLSDEQVKALVERRQAVWDEVYTTPPAKADVAARTAASDAAMKKVLTPEQYRRATQLGAQRVLNTGFPGGGLGKGQPVAFVPRVTAAMLKSYPELTDVFKLTEDQQKALNTGGVAGGPKGGKFTVGVALTREQQAAVKEFLGLPLPRGWWSTKWDPRLSFPGQPQEIALLQAKDVRADVALTDDQARGVAAVREKWTKLNADSREMSPKDEIAAATALRAESEKELAATLNPGQLVRLRQIARQDNAFAGTHVEGFYKNQFTAKEFDITAEQMAALDGIWAAYRGDAAKVFEAGGPVAEIDAKVKALAAARRAKAEGVLTTAQAAKLRDTFGPPFTGSTRLDGVRVTGVNVEQMRAATFGKYSAEFTRLARDSALQAELKLTPEQVKQAEQIRVELLKTPLNPPFQPDVTDTAAAERSAAVEAGLKKVLTPDQAKRFREIMLQARERTLTVRGGPAGRISTVVESAAAYPGVAEEIRLTAEQRKSLLAGTAPAEVLTADQKAAIAKMLGAPYEPAPAVAPLFRVSQYLMVLSRGDEATAAALTLTPEQEKAVEAALEAYQAAIRAAGPGFGGFGADTEAGSKARAAAVEEFERSVSKTLTPAQQKLVPQIALQVRAASDIETALTAPDVAKALGLTADQKARLAALGDEAEKTQRLVATHQADTPDQALGHRLRDAADARMLAVLTDAQRATWRELTGEPVPGLRKTIPGRFGGPGGGFGGGGGFGVPPGGGFGNPGGFP